MTETAIHTTSNPRLVDKIEHASRVIAPLWPIATFAARSPWMGLENETFDDVARWLKSSRHVDIYPSAGMLLQAKQKGELADEQLIARIDAWLANQSFTIATEQLKTFCYNAMKFEDNSIQHDEDSAEAAFEQRLNYHVIKWCKLYIDKSESGWVLPNRQAGFYGAWQKMIHADPALSKMERKRLDQWPSDALAGLEKAFDLLGISEDREQDTIEGYMLALPGWAGMLLWRSQQGTYDPNELLDYIAIRASLEWALRGVAVEFQTNDRAFTDEQKAMRDWQQFGELSSMQWDALSSENRLEYSRFAHTFDDMTRRQIGLEAWEMTHRAGLQKKLQRQAEDLKTKKPLAQLTFCIDVRSEPFRRHLEQHGPFETIGMAGFFGLPIATCELGSNYSHPSLPVILRPQQQVMETTGEEIRRAYLERMHTLSSISQTFKALKQNTMASLLLPELSGPILTLQMATRSLLPKGAGNVLRSLRNKWLKKPETTLTIHDMGRMKDELPIGFTLEQQVAYAEQAINLMSIRNGFAPLVVVCGHGSQTTNNPYAASLDCGACGGAAGGINARALAQLCNLPEVREGLRTKGIHIPEETVFAAALHNTTLDLLEWLYVPELTAEAQEAFEKLEEVMPEVTEATNVERLRLLPPLYINYSEPKDAVKHFAEDWSEIRPEWGLARNNAFIIGSRELTEASDLEGRAFLHSYDYKQDPTGELLASIIGGPGTVCQWINLQYYASTVAPHFYGSGNKITQSVTAGLGVMQGNASDLMTGLPWQSVMRSDHEIFHSPVRLLIVIEAPNAHIERLLAADEAFATKVQNGWVRLASVDKDGVWTNWTSGNEKAS